MEKIKSEFKAASPPLGGRRYGGFFKSKIKPRLKNHWKKYYGYRKPHGQES